jgi:hypothetical protein
MPILKVSALRSRLGMMKLATSIAGSRSSTVFARIPDAQLACFEAFSLREPASASLENAL